MRLKKNASDVRIRFTMAHEFCHTFLLRLVPEIKFSPHETDDEEERLCNLGAAAFAIARFRVASSCEEVAALSGSSNFWLRSTESAFLR